ncbi:hypothetical protein B2D07_07835 [Desulfococcus multivorans]|uniref:CO dehydrogenase/acetyl-CoA synthase delta subunit, TIM barrel n=1 Tax=Desulfococcus multivorans DSM 2059 TaxID=1121405 RepID=S7U0P6_DESML|nr:CO dehydrogenase/acetyl-CoA synthase complex, subunit delta [Desulfococcus multivorans]AQV00692.1 hypothetical protein B2D07_07835 [Desulfococcus multivorans]EPR42565.1 CO dehydrogenase/acetyl-CoA synthase delta subunit, TIM barrel [Desulfococcus multivorans DSM 2059]SKA18583.1 CO dehydrogenase/acetyl-CoA synthase delta subunit [Desulfococcus multivorans DSM 2059]
METSAGPVPRVETAVSLRDKLGTVKTRLGIGRYNYKVVPGLYCVGTPGPESPVLMTANYKLTFDALRKELGGLDAWILAADTRGINVWCAAGKGLFSTEEVVRRVNRSRLAEIVSHRELILPQLSATGIAAHQVKKICGFKVIYGPIRAADIPAFIQAGKTADQAMRTVTFTFRERAVLTPVEILLLRKALAVVIIATLFLSGFGPGIFSMDAALSRGIPAVCATLFGILAGAVIVPFLLPHFPWREFWISGALAGIVAGVANTWLFNGRLDAWESLSLMLWTGAVGSYLAMNFTGSTPYTSPSGVEKEMRRAIPAQVAAGLIAVAVWFAAPFFG